MIKDHIVEKVRINREKLFAEFGFDIRKFSDHIYKMQRKYKDKLVTKPFIRRKSDKN